MERSYTLNLKAITSPVDVIELLFMLGVLKPEHQVIKMTDEQYLELSKRGGNNLFSILHINSEDKQTKE